MSQIFVLLVMIISEVICCFIGSHLCKRVEFDGLAFGLIIGLFRVRVSMELFIVIFSVSEFLAVGFCLNISRKTKILKEIIFE